MRFDRLLIVTLLLLLGLLPGQNAAASHPTPTQTRSGVPYRKVYLPGADAQMAVCKLGQYGAPVSTVADSGGGTIYFHENDTYWTYIEVNPDSCPGCGSGTAGTLSVAHLALFFPYAPETVVVNVSVITSVPIPCHLPNWTDPSAYICDPFGAVLICPDPLTLLDFGIPFPTECKINVPDNNKGQAFLGFEFVTANDTTQAHKPQIAVGQNAKACYSYNPVGFIPYDMVTEYNVGNPIMYAEVERCELVPVVRRSWGQLKRHYR